ncbi:hypothetical protein COOONC_14612 [Cooperia oncophora]
MSGVATQVFALSRLTLSLFEDSGWYKVNYDKAEDMTWGRNLGCTFAQKSCLTWMKKNPRNPYPFCRIYEHQRCSSTRKAKLRCSLVAENKTLPDQYNYNVRGLYQDQKGKEILGHGSIELADFCPYYRVYTDSSKEDSDTRCTYPDNMHYNNYSLEVSCSNSRKKIELSSLTRVFSGCLIKGALN